MSELMYVNRVVTWPAADLPRAPKASLVNALRRAGRAPSGRMRHARQSDSHHFLDLQDLVQATHGRHAGILVVRSDNDPARDMKDRDVVRALANLEAAQVSVENGFHILNHWR